MRNCQFLFNFMSSFSRKNVYGREIALYCSQAPEGHERWTLRMLADKMVELDIVDAVSHETVRRTLKKRNVNPGKSKHGVFRQSKMPPVSVIGKKSEILTNNRRILSIPKCV